jgi:hypothetical protein
MIVIDISPSVGTSGRPLTEAVIDEVKVVAFVIAFAILFELEVVADIVTRTLTEPALKTTFKLLAITPLISEMMLVAMACLIALLFWSLKALKSNPWTAKNTCTTCITLQLLPSHTQCGQGQVDCAEKLVHANVGASVGVCVGAVVVVGADVVSCEQIQLVNAL